MTGWVVKDQVKVHSAFQMAQPTKGRQWFGRFRAGLASAALCGLLPTLAPGQSPTFAANAQHTGIYSVPAKHLNRIRWSTSVNLTNAGENLHYGAPLITPSNTVIVPVRTAAGFQVSAFEAATGRLKYTLATDYVLPKYAWLPVYQPLLDTSIAGGRLYYPGAGGTLLYVEGPDSDSPRSAVRECFYTDLTSFSNNFGAFRANIFVNTPITADTNGVVFFGFRVSTNGAPAPLSTPSSGFARIDPFGDATYVLAAAAASDQLATYDSHNCAPALSNDGSTLYVAVKSPASVPGYRAYLLGLDATTLATRYRVAISRGIVDDDSTASPVVGPDGDVFFGISASERGLLLHFSGDLSVQKPPGSFGWDYTPALVPASMVPSYAGTSSYLIFSKYNNYAYWAFNGDGVNRIALLDPGATQIDPSNRSLIEMREVLSVIGCTPDQEYQGPSHPYAVREWCINTAAVNPATHSVFAPSEDGHIYRWDLAANSLTEAFALTPGVFEAYVPTAIGPDGAIYTLNGGHLFCLDSFSNAAVVVYSSTPDLRSVVAGQPVIFTAIVTNAGPSGPAPTGTVTFEDASVQGLSLITKSFASVLLADGVAVVTNFDLAASTNVLGSHFITAKYGGDTSFPPASATLVQKVHAYSTAMSVTAGPISGASITLTAAVSAIPLTPIRPTGLVSFWDGPKFLAQIPLPANGFALFTNASLAGATHAFSATYCSDTLFASSSAQLMPNPYSLSGTLLSNGDFQLSFSNSVSAAFRVLCSPVSSWPQSDWIELGSVPEIARGQFQFIDPGATNNTARFYRVRSP